MWFIYIKYKSRKMPKRFFHYISPITKKGLAWRKITEETFHMKTYMAKSSDVVRKWYLIDATNLPLGRLATAVTDILTGKKKTIYTPHVDTGDFVVVINSDKMVLTGKKIEKKKLVWHTGYIGGLKEVGYDKLMQENSPKALEKAVKGMLPKTSLGRKQFTRLHIYKGAEHEQAAQKPEQIVVKGARE